MPRVKVAKNKVVRRSHIKYVGLQVATVLKYRKAVARFFAWMKGSNFPLPVTLPDLDVRAAEYINELYQDDLPLGWASDFICGLKRLYPNSKRNLETASSYLRNWQKATVRTRAMPVTLEVVQAMATVSYVRKRPEMAQALLLSFAGLLRVSEIISAKFGQLNFLKEDYAILTLPNSKGASRSGQPETVVFKDTALIAQLKARWVSEGSQSFICPGTYGSFTREYKELRRFLGLHSESFTPHGLRRGGATWHFGLFYSYDRTQDHGRWSHQRTARQYIDEAMAESGLGDLSVPAIERINRAARCLDAYV